MAIIILDLGKLLHVTDFDVSLLLRNQWLGRRNLRGVHLHFNLMFFVYLSSNFEGVVHLTGP